MLGISMLIWSVVIWPVVIRSRLYLNAETLPHGSLLIRTIGVSLCFDWRIERTEERLVIRIRFYERRKSISSEIGAISQNQVDMQKILTRSSYLKKDFISYLQNCRFKISLRLGTGNAASTALCCASIASIFGAISNITGTVIPDFRNQTFSAKVDCIASLRLGKLMVSAVQILRAKASEYFIRQVGGSVHG